MPGSVLFYVIFWGVFLLALGIFAYRTRQLSQYLLLGQKEARQNLGRKINNTLAYIISQLCQLKNLKLSSDWAPLGHAFMVWGFFVSIVFYFFFIIIAEGLGFTGLENSNFYFYFTWAMDFMSMFIFLGAAWALIRRYIIRPDRLRGEQTWEAFIILISVLTHPITQVFEIGTKIALGEPPAGLGTALPPVSNLTSHLFVGVSNLEGWHAGFLWAHWLTVVVVLVIIPYTRYMHIIASVFNGILRNPRRISTIKSIDLENAESFGTAKINNLTWKQNLDLYSCVVCGNCQELCPAFATGKPINPKKVIQDLKRQLLTAGPELVKARSRGAPEPANPNVILAGNVISEDEIWACTTCGACDCVCPVWVDHIDKIVDLRRNLVMEQAKIPETAEGALRSIESRGHPWRGTPLSRTDWTAGLNIKTLEEDADVEYLYWVGCTEALEEESTSIAKSISRILQTAGVSFGILGTEETCCGDPARRLGNEYLYQTLAAQNIEVMNRYKVKKIVTGCPHCYNTLKKEYPQFGGNYQVLHHTELIAELIKAGKIKPEKGLDAVVTYHDSCYLGRNNDIYQPPRQILKSVPDLNLIEMRNREKRGFCCGGGGGRLWLEEHIGQRISENRTEQALATKAQMIATACPYCFQMFDDAIKSKAAEEKLKVRDIAQIISESL